MRGVQVGKVDSIESRPNGQAVLHLAMYPSEMHLIPSNVLVDQNGHMWLSGFGDCFLNCLTSAKRAHRRKSSPAPSHIWRQNKPVA